MGILITRGILLIILCLISVIVIEIITAKKVKKLKEKSKQELSDIEIKNYIKKLRKRMGYILIAFLVVIAFVSSYPFEGSFLRFRIPDASLQYSEFKSFFSENTIIDGEDCYFVASMRGNNISYHTISKYGDKVGVTDYKAQKKYLGQNVESTHLLTCYAIYNEVSDTSCYFISYSLPTEDEKDTEILINGQSAECVIFKEDATAKYALIVDGKFQENIIVNVNGIDRKII